MGLRVGGISFGGKPVYRADWLIQQCVEKNIDTSSWFGKCNSYRNALGAAPGEAWLLMLRKDVKTLLQNEASAHYLKMTTGTQETNPTGTDIARLWIDYAYAAAPSFETDGDTLYVVHALDKRHLANRYPFNPKRYNIRSRADLTTFYSWSKNGDDEWTWETMFQNIWNQQAGGLHFPNSWPGFPDTFEIPADNPEGYVFDADYCLNVIQQAAESVSLSLSFDNYTDRFELVDIGEIEDGVTAKIESHRKDVVFDAFGLENYYMLIPGKTRMIMPIEHKSRGDENMMRRRFDNEDVTLATLFDAPVDDVGIAANKVDPGAMLLIHDHRPAVWKLDDGNDNGEERETDADYLNDKIPDRAKDRGREALFALSNHSNRPTFRRLMFSGVKSDFKPGGRISAVKWGDIGGGPFTELTMSKAAPKFIRRDPYLIGGGGCNSQNCQQSITIYGKPDGGSISVVICGFTIVIPFDATADDIETLMEPHWGVLGDDPINVVGGAFPNGTMLIEFTNDQGGKVQTPITAQWGDLTGGTGVGVQILVVAEGR
jgi:hypothetical protein